MTTDRDYVLGTHDDEIVRLGLQHRVWRARALDAWRRAGFTVGQTILDLGSGPGYASIDLAELVGGTGRIIAIDRSRRFLDALQAARSQRGLENIETIELDLDDGTLPAVRADGAWSRWVFSFVTRPRDLLARVREALKPGGVLVLHEYFHYSTWRLAPRSSAIEEFVRIVMESWRASGGEPDIALDLPGWLHELGFEMRSVQPIIEAVSPSSWVWQWPKAFIEVGLRRMVEIGSIVPDRAREMSAALSAAEAAPQTLMFTPGVLEIIAVRR